MMDRPHPILSKIDPSFLEEAMENYDLVFQVGLKSTSWSVFDHLNNRYVALEHYHVPVYELKQHILWLEKPARSVTVIIDNIRSTLIPAMLFDEPVKEKYLNFTVEQQEDEKVLAEQLSTLDIVNIYGVDDLIYDQVSAIFPKAKIVHLSTILIDGIWIHFKNQLHEKRIFLHAGEDDFTMLVFEKKQLLFSNAFHYQAPEDFLYYVMFVMEQFDLNPEEVPVVLMGNIEKDSPLYNLLFRYIRNLEFSIKNDSVGYSPVIREIPGHKYFTLLTPGLCGS